MRVAWQFTAWNAFTKKARPVLSAIVRMATEEGHGLSWSTDRFANQGCARFLPTQSYRCLRDGFGFLHPLAVNYQATITWSLLDKSFPETCLQDRLRLKGEKLCSCSSSKAAIPPELIANLVHRAGSFPVPTAAGAF
jgi:hypothetical protein